MGKRQEVQQELLEIIKELPDTTGVDLVQLMPHVDKTVVRRELANLARHGKVRRAAVVTGRRGGKPFAYRLREESEEPTPVPPRARRTRRRPASDTVTEQRIAQLEAHVNELIQWKAEAIERYPDLAIDPVVLQARKVVAEIANKTDVHYARRILNGELDTCLAMRATVEALSRVS